MSGLISFPYYGAKNRAPIRNQIISLFPRNYTELHYVEPCFGSGAVFFNKQRSVIETINDLDLDVVNFFEVLRRQPDDLIRALKLTPWAREEFEKSNTPQLWLSDLEQARLFYTRVRQGFTGSSRMQSNGWRHSKRPEARSQSPCETWKNGVEKLQDVAERLLEAQIENRDVLQVLDEYDGPNTLFYIDPTYVLEARNANKLSYTHEMSEQQHRALVKKLLTLKGKVILSGYKHGVCKPLEKAGWLRKDIETISTAGKERPIRTERLWLNYQPPQLSLFPMEVI